MHPNIIMRAQSKCPSSLTAAPMAALPVVVVAAAILVAVAMLASVAMLVVLSTILAVFVAASVVAAAAILVPVATLLAILVVILVVVAIVMPVGGGHVNGGICGHVGSGGSIGGDILGHIGGYSRCLGRWSGQCQTWMIYRHLGFIRKAKNSRFGGEVQCEYTMLTLEPLVEDPHSHGRGTVHLQSSPLPTCHKVALKE